MGTAVPTDFAAVADECPYAHSVTRRQEFATLLPQIIFQEMNGDPVDLGTIYVAVERDRPDRVDEDIEPPPSNVLRWRHALRWEIETLVVGGTVRSRKDLGRAIYSL